MFGSPWLYCHCRNTTHFVAQFPNAYTNFNGNQLYIGDETFNQTRLSIQPNGGPIYMQGNITQNSGGYGLPKAMVYVNGDGTVIRCYNGITGSSTGGCGISVSKFSAGFYNVNVGFSTASCFFSVSVQDDGGAGPVVISYSPVATGVWVYVHEAADELAGSGINTDRPFTVIVY